MASGRAKTILLRGWLGWALTLCFVMLCWVLFRSPDFGTAAQVLQSMDGLHGIGKTTVPNAGAMVLGAALALLGPTSQRLALELVQPRPWLALPVGAGLVFLLLMIGGRLPNEFIYFQF